MVMPFLNDYLIYCLYIFVSVYKSFTLDGKKLVLPKDTTSNGYEHSNVKLLLFKDNMKNK